MIVAFENAFLPRDNNLTIYSTSTAQYQHKESYYFVCCSGFDLYQRKEGWSWKYIHLVFTLRIHRNNTKSAFTALLFHLETKNNLSPDGSFGTVAEIISVLTNAQENAHHVAHYVRWACACLVNKKQRVSCFVAEKTREDNSNGQKLVEPNSYTGLPLLSANIGQSQIFRYWCICSTKYYIIMLKQFFMGRKNAWISDFKNGVIT